MLPWSGIETEYICVPALSLTVGKGTVLVMRLCSWFRHYAASLKVAGSSPDEVIELLFFFNSPTPSIRTYNDLGVGSACNTYVPENLFWWLKCGWRVRPTDLPPSVSRLLRACGIVDILQAYRPLRPVTGIALLLILPFSINCLLSDAVIRQMCWDLEAVAVMAGPTNWSDGEDCGGELSVRLGSARRSLCHFLEQGLLGKGRIH
jgi:hypothetical protein